MRIYISGPMTGLPEFNFRLFRATADHLLELGHVPLDPSCGKHADKPWPREVARRRDFHMVLMAEAIAVLPGWQSSKGALAEVAMGRMLGLPILDAATLEELEVEINMEAQELVRV